MDDLIWRLRINARSHLFANTPIAPLFEEAALEIERLRRLVPKTKPCEDCKRDILPVTRNHVRCAECAEIHRVTYHKAYAKRRYKPKRKRPV